MKHGMFAESMIVEAVRLNLRLLPVDGGRRKRWEEFMRMGFGRTCFIILAVVYFTAAPGPLMAGDAAPGKKAAADLAAYLKEAAENNASLKAAYHRFQAALEKIPQEKYLPDPRISFGYFIEPVETRVGPQQARIGLSQTFPWIGKLLAKGDRAAREADAEKARFDALRLSIFAEVKKTYFEYAYLLRAIDVTRDNRDLLNYLESVVQARYAAGVSPYADVLSIQLERDKLDDRLRALEDFKNPLAAVLNAAMNRDPGVPLPDRPDVPVMTAELSDDELLGRMSKANPSLWAYDSLAAKERIGVSLAKMEFIPEVTLGVETILTGDYNYYLARPDSQGNPTMGSPPPRDSGKDAWIASLSLNIPLWFGKRTAGIREARSRELAALKDREGLEKKLGADMKLALYKYRDAVRKIELYQDALIPRGEQALAASLEAYHAGKAGFSDLVNAQRALLEFELNHVRALTDQAQRLAEIEMLVGEDVSFEIYGSMISLTRYQSPIK